MPDKVVGSLIGVQIVFYMLFLACYIYFIRLANSDDTNHTCKSSWWLRLIGILGIIGISIPLLVTVGAAFMVLKH